MVMPTKTIVSAVGIFQKNIGIENGCVFNHKEMEINQKLDLANENILLFDGVCNLCNASVQWILLRDKKRVFKFAALQSETGAALLQQFGRESGSLDTATLISGNHLFLRSDAALEICRRLGGIYSLAVVFKIIPRFIRNRVYDWVARNRYRWFGQQEQCMLPRPEWKDRFV
jgi:hypothetical protein